MIHPLLRLIATKPQLLADHAEAYAGLLGEEWGKTTAEWKHRLLLNAIALCLAGVALVLGGVALMFWAVTASSNIQAPWALILVPVVPVVVALLCVFAGRKKQASAFGDLKQQMSADLAMLREVSPS